jgi:hypothetical protein
MYLQPVQITDEGVLIPHHYLHDARDLVIEYIDGYVLIRPKPNGKQIKETESPRYDWIGIASSGIDDASVEVEKILAEEIDNRSGWTLKK